MFQCSAHESDSETRRHATHEPARLRALGHNGPSQGMAGQGQGRLTSLWVSALLPGPVWRHCAWASCASTPHLEDAAAPVCSLRVRSHPNPLRPGSRAPHFAVPVHSEPVGMRVEVSRLLRAVWEALHHGWRALARLQLCLHRRTAVSLSEAQSALPVDSKRRRAQQEPATHRTAPAAHRVALHGDDLPSCGLRAREVATKLVAHVAAVRV